MRVPRVPKPKRRIGKSGKEVGNYYIRSHGAEINLATKDPDEAIRRATAYAKTGKANWLEDEVAAARATIAGMNTDAPVDEPTPPGVPPASAQPPPAAPASAQSPPAAAAPAPAPAPPASDPGSRPSSAAAPLPAPPASSPDEDEAEEPDDDWSNDAQQAAEETAQQEDAAPPSGAPTPKGFEFAFDPQTIEMIIKTAASNAVDYQLLLQAVLIKKKTGDDAPMISHESLSWKVPYSIWEGQFRHWLSNVRLDRVPPWLAAILLTALMARGQYQHRQKPKPRGNLGVVVDADFSEVGDRERKAA
jgi:hypothetical protein